MLGQASSAAQDERQEQATAFELRLRELDTQHAKMVKQLESQIKRYDADSLRMQATVSRLIESTQRQHAEEIAAARTEEQAAQAEAQAAKARAGAASAAAAASAATAASSSSRLNELEELRDDVSMTAIAKKLLGGDALNRVLAIPSLDDVGSRGDVGQRRLADAAFVVGAVLEVLLDATPLGQNDPAAVLEAVARRRGASSTLTGKALLSLMNGANAAGEDGLVVLGKAYRSNLSSGDKSTARTILSLLVSIGGVRHSTIKRVCSLIPSIAPQVPTSSTYST